MARTQHTVHLTDLARIVDDPEHGIISMVGDHGGLSLITDGIDLSAIVLGTLVVETEHGSVYLNHDAEITISEDDGADLDQHATGSLFAVNDLLTAFLAERFDWYSTDNISDEALNDATHSVAEVLSDLLSILPVNRDTATTSHRAA
ncbi:hypothetical protein [Psychromicrobium sp. YIM B11713]|uniref:hypothetical protein n=1 Tax=Psychromicrobium sp. YIM B11713 TaxID=3145233 RepID=UPI00374EA545